MLDLELMNPQNTWMHILEGSSAIPASCYRNRILLHICLSCSNRVTWAKIFMPLFTRIKIRESSQYKGESVKPRICEKKKKVPPTAFQVCGNTDICTHAFKNHKSSPWQTIEFKN